MAESNLQPRKRYGCINSIGILIMKIGRLKKKLFSYGLSVKDTMETIMRQFLKTPPIDWELPQNTAVFYKIQ